MPYPTKILASDPIRYFRLDETAGTTAVNEVGVNGAYHGTVAYNEPAAIIGGVRAKGFNGTDTSLVVPWTQLYQGTISLWFAPADAHGGGQWGSRFDIFSGTSSGSNGRFLLYRVNADTLRLYYHTGVIHTADIDATGWNANEYHHIACTFSCTHTVGGPIAGGNHSNTNFGIVFDTKQRNVRLNTFSIEMASAATQTFRLQAWDNEAVGPILHETSRSLSSGVNNNVSLDWVVEEPGRYILYKVEDTGAVRTDTGYDFNAQTYGMIDVITGAQSTGSTFDRYYYFFNLTVGEGELATLVDGKKVDTTPVPNSMDYAANADLHFMSDRNVQNYGAGRLDEAAVWDYVLSDAEIASQYAAGKYQFVRFQDSLLQPPDTPTNFAIERVGSEAHLSWDAVDDAETYTVRRERWTGSAWGELSTFSDIAATSYQDSTVAPDEEYRYSVQAVNAAGSSDFTGWIEFSFIQVAGRSASSSRGSASISTPLSVSGRSATSTRSSASLTIPTFLAGRSSSTSRALVAVDVTSQVAAHSSTSSRGSLEVGDTSINLSMGSAGGSRSTAILATGTSLTGRSSSTNRSSLVLGETLVGLSGRSSTPSRSTLVVLPINFTSGSSVVQDSLAVAETIAGRSSTQGRAELSLDVVVRVDGRSSTLSRSDLELASSIGVEGRSSTSSSTSLLFNSEIDLVGRSSTASRGEVLLDASVDVSAVSTTSSRSDLVVSSSVSLGGRSSTSSRSALSLDVIEATRLDGRSSTASRASVALTSDLSVDGRSSTSSRSVLDVRVVEVTEVSGWSSTESRGAATIDSEVELSGRSSTGSRSTVSVDAPTSLSGRSGSTSRASAVVARVDFTVGSDVAQDEVQVDFIVVSGRSSTTSRASASLKSEIGVSGRSGTLSRSGIVAATETRIGGRSSTASRGELVLDVVVSFGGSSVTSSRSVLRLDAVEAQFEVELSWTEDDDATLIEGVTEVPEVEAELSWAEDDDAVAIGATFSVADVTVSISWTEEDDVSDIEASHAAPVYESSLSWAEEDDSVAISGEHDPPVFESSLSWAEDDDATSISANFTAAEITASLGWIEDDDVAEISATTEAPLFESELSWNEDDDFVSISGEITIPPVDASLSWTEDDDDVDIRLFFGAFSGKMPVRLNGTAVRDASSGDARSRQLAGSTAGSGLEGSAVRRNLHGRA